MIIDKNESFNNPIYLHQFKISYPAQFYHISLNM